MTSTSCSYFLLGSLHVLLLRYNTPCTTVFSLYALLLFLYIYTTNTLKLEMHIKENDLFYFVFSQALEHYFMQSYLRYRIFSIFGGLTTIAGATAFIYSLLSCKMSNTTTPFTGLFSVVRHPLHSSLFIFLVGSCVYLSSFVSLAVLVWYIRTNVSSFAVLDEVYKDHEEYLRNVPSGIPFMITEVKKKKD
ncbi:Farnesyl cysteine-carboxyl methyltransferase [Trachipleistophora hominis]|uniref:Farnesyl cysteine-carboxyl methyltransferase n=1 Tax=Trachipleistophora hominis TaxID=72359 RepID=L7K023_TRAHO|nr:Farnesyl cysteine-carboxyl methyltransferase [Trachipleistophora hominis]